MQASNLNGETKAHISVLLNATDEWCRELYERGMDADARDIEQSIEWIENNIDFNDSKGE